jgi:hypothetical protein
MNGGGAGAGGNTNNYSSNNNNYIESNTDMSTNNHMLQQKPIQKKKTINFYDESPAVMNKVVLQEIDTILSNPTDITDITQESGNIHNNDTNQQQQQRRAVSYYPNTVQENVKLMRDYYEQQAFIPTPSGSRSYEDLTETTVDEDNTESSNLDNDDITKSNTLRVDCQNDPYESAYAVWYRKGLLKWRPKSVPHNELPIVLSSSGQEHRLFTFDENENHTKDIPTVTQSHSVDLIVVDVSQPKNNTVQQNDEDTKSKNEDMDEVAKTKSLLQKYRNSSSHHTLCINCQKDMSLKTIQIVKCIHCQQELYCSLFCRGNDRYQHSMTCPAQQQQKQSKSLSSLETIKATTIPTTPNRNKHVVLDENDISSRSNSYKKSRQAPMVSLFGPNGSGDKNKNSNGHHLVVPSTTTGTVLSARRLTTEFYA